MSSKQLVLNEDLKEKTNLKIDNFDEVLKSNIDAKQI